VGRYNGGGLSPRSRAQEMWCPENSVLAPGRQHRARRRAAAPSRRRLLLLRRPARRLGPGWCPLLPVADQWQRPPPRRPRYAPTTMATCSANCGALLSSVAPPYSSSLSFPSCCADRGPSVL